jgi:hypothetical protein
MFIFYFTDEWRVPLKRGSKVGYPWKAPAISQGLHIIIKRLNHQGISSKYLHLNINTDNGRYRVISSKFCHAPTGAPHHQYIIKINRMRIKVICFLV